MEKEYIERLVETEQRSKSNTKRIDAIEKSTAILQKMDYRMSNVEENIEKINTKLDETSEKKVMRWDKLIDYLFYAIIGYALFKLGLK